MPTDLADLVRAFLIQVASNANTVPDLFDSAFTSSGLRGGRPPPARVKGLLMQLAERDGEKARAFEQSRAELTQQFISRKQNHTGYFAVLRDLYRRDEADRSSLREHWYCGLALSDQKAIENHCLAVAETVLLTLFPPELPACLRGPLARLALEYAALMRRGAARRDEMAKSLASRGLGNRTVVDSILQAFANSEEEAKSRLEGRWLRELTSEQEVQTAGRPGASDREKLEALDNVLKAAATDSAGTGSIAGATPSFDTANPNPLVAGKKPKRYPAPAGARDKLVSALTKHHDYAHESCLNQEPIGNNQLAIQACVSRSTASNFFKKEFRGYAKYKALCRDSGGLAAALKLLNNEFAPHNLYGRRPAGEDDRDDAGDE
jgi:hypothetical protein